MEALLVVVLYKESATTSKTISSLLENCLEYLQDTFIVIWDNSPSELSPEELKYISDKRIKFVYKNTPQNLPLSEVYNKAIENYGKDKEKVFLFDQDSLLTPAYFQKMENAISENEDIDLFVPYIEVNNQIVSPGEMGFYNGKYIKEKIVGKIHSRNMIAITSGMAIRITLFHSQNIKFDENLSLYGIDTAFCLEYSAKNTYLFIINYQLIHSLSLFEKEDIKTKLYRFKNERCALLYILKKRSKIRYFIAYIIFIIKYNFLFLSALLK